MRKPLFILLLLIAVGSAFAQTYLVNEGFESTTFPPTGWTNSTNGCVRSINNPRTGSACLGFNGLNDAIYTPKLINPSQLSFYYRRSSTADSWTLRVQVSTDASNWATLNVITNASTGYQQYTRDLSTYSNIYVRLLDQRSTGTAERYVDDFTVTASTAKTINVDPSSLVGFTYVYGAGPSAEKNFSLTGSNLTGNLSISITSDYEIASSSGGSYSSSLSYTPSSGSVSATVYVRQKSGMDIGNGYTGTITCSSDGATDKTVSLSGTVTAPPPPSAPTATDASNVASNSFKANWNSVSGANGYRFDVYQKSITPTTLVEGFNGGTTAPAGWTFTAIGGTYTTAGNFGVSSPSLQFDATGDAVETPTLSLPSSLSFWIKGQTTNASSALTVTQYDGSSWTTLATVTNLPTTGTTKTYSLSSNITKIKFTYTKSTGNLAFDDVEINHNAITVSYVSGYQDIDANNATIYDVMGLSAGSTYYYAVRAYNAYGTGASSNEIEVTTSAYDYPEDQPVTAGDVTITVNTGNGNNSASSTTTAPNANFVTSFAQVITLLGDGPWNITLAAPTQTVTWFAYRRGSTWTSLANTSGSVTFEIPAAKYAEIEIQAGSGQDPTLPVELSSFTALVNTQNMINIQWITQSESNLNGYYIQRGSSDQLSQAVVVSPLIHATNSSQQQVYLYTDNELQESGTYYYWLEVQEMDGTMTFHGPRMVIYNADGNPGTPNAPLLTELKSVYPNPFNPSATIQYALAKDARVNLAIYNARGQLVRSFAEGDKASGTYNVIWNGTDNYGRECGTGIYYIHMQAGAKSFMQKAVLMKQN